MEASLLYVKTEIGIQAEIAFSRANDTEKYEYTSETEIERFWLDKVELNKRKCSFVTGCKEISL